jgi:uncharacterized protein (TIGR03083 family)
MTDPMDVLAALTSSQQRLSALVKTLSPADIERLTSDEGWSVAEVLGHLGSQSEIFTLFVDAGLNGTKPPSNETFEPIWEAWNSRSPQAKASDALAAGAAFLEHVRSLDKEQLDRFELDLFGMHLDAAQLLAMRLSEYTLHTWDVEVVFDDEAVLPSEATELLIDRLGTLVPRVGKPDGEPQSIGIVTSSPERRFVLDTSAVSLVPGDAADGSPQLQLTSEALIRLVYGRLDERHLGVPAPQASSVDLDKLRKVFPGV